MGIRKPIYLLAGNPGARRLDADPLVRAALNSSGASAPSIAYVGAACNDDRSFFTMLSRLFAKSGAGEIVPAPTVRRFDRRLFEKTCSAADTVFISGGDVGEGMAVVEKRKLTPLFRELYRGGKLLWGLSAGSIMLARQWVRWRDEDDDSSAELFACLGFADILCDTHGEEDRWGELKSLLRLEPDTSIGYGIRTSSGLRVDPEGTVVPLGKVDIFVNDGGKVKKL